MDYLSSRTGVSCLISRAKPHELLKLHKFDLPLAMGAAGAGWAGPFVGPTTGAAANEVKIHYCLYF